MRTRMIAGLSIASLLLLGLPTVATAAPSAVVSEVALAETAAAGSIQITPDHDPIRAGDYVVYTVTVVADPAKGAPTGKIWQTSGPGGADLPGPVELVNGPGTFTAGWALHQTASVNFRYEGDSNYAATSGSLPVTILKRLPDFEITTSGQLSPGSAVTLSALLDGSSSKPSGTVTFTGADGVPHVANIANGEASWTTTLPQGTHTFVASYSGDSLYESVDPGRTVQVSIDRLATTTTLTASPLSPRINETVVLRAAGLPQTSTGTVTFSGLGLPDQTAPVANGAATLTTSFTSAGLKQVVATYSGDGAFAGSISAPALINVAKLALPLSLTSNTNSAFVGQNVTFTAATAADATGSVTFYNGITPIGTSTVVSGTATLSFQFDTARTHVITAIYSGDAKYNGVTSNGQSISISRWATAVGLSLSATELEAGNPLTLTTDLPADATGTVNFSIDGQPVGAAQVVGGVIKSTATLAVPMNSAGSFVARALYSGDAKYLPGSSAAKGVLVSPSTTTLTLTASKTEVTVDESSLFTVRLPAGATGSVVFYAGTGALTAVPVVDGVASLSVTYDVAGVRTISAKYPGDANHKPAESNSIDLTVMKFASTITLTASATSVEVGSDVVLTATVPASRPGNVEFFNGTKSLGTADPQTGTASITVSFAEAGTQSITARYFDSPRYADASSEAFYIEVGQVASTTVLSLSATEIALGDELTLTAEVTAGATGDVEFRDGASVLGTVTATDALATLPFTFDAAGTHSITAHYLGNARFAPSGSLAQDVVVNKLATGVVVESDDDTIDLGDELTLTATLDAAATGTVEFFDGADSLGSATISDGTARFDWEFTAAGEHSITAVYSGNDDFVSATSAEWLVTVNKLVSVVTIDTVDGSIDLGDELTLTATLDAGATGTVEFFADAAVAGPGARVAGAESLGTAPVVAGVAALDVTFTTAGARSITAVYSGDDTFAQATSDAWDVTVNKLVSDISIEPSAGEVEVGAELDFLVEVNAAATGTVEFFDGADSLGTVPVTDGSATLRTSFATAGTRSVTAVYSGDDTYAAATAEAAAVKVADKAEPAAPAAPAKPADLKPLAGTGTADTRGLILLGSGLAVLGLLAAAGSVVTRRKQAL